jgi:6-phosphofructokinase 1
MANLAIGAEQVYLSEEGVTLKDLQRDVDELISGFRSGRRLGLLIRNERCNPIYSTDFMAALFRQEGEGIFEVRQTILGHLQQGGNPTPFDRIQATRLAARCIGFLIDKAESGQREAAFIGLQNGQVRTYSLEDFPRMVDWTCSRPKHQWWLDLLPIARLLARSAPQPPEIVAGGAR